MTKERTKVCFYFDCQDSYIYGFKLKADELPDGEITPQLYLDLSNLPKIYEPFKTRQESRLFIGEEKGVGRPWTRNSVPGFIYETKDQLFAIEIPIYDGLTKI